MELGNIECFFTCPYLQDSSAQIEIINSVIEAKSIQGIAVSVLNADAIKDILYLPNQSMQEYMSLHLIVMPQAAVGKLCRCKPDSSWHWIGEKIDSFGPQWLEVWEVWND